MTKHYVDGRPLKEWCQENDLNYYTVMGRMHRGYTLQESLKKNIKGDYSKSRYNTRKHYIDGKPLKERCKEKGICYQTALYRIKKGIKKTCKIK